MGPNYDAKTITVKLRYKTNDTYITGWFKLFVAINPQRKYNAVLEYLNFLCIALGRSEDFGQQGRKRRLSYSKPSISNAAG